MEGMNGRPVSEPCGRCCVSDEGVKARYFMGAYYALHDECMERNIDELAGA